MSQLPYYNNGYSDIPETPPISIHHDEEYHFNNHLENSMKKMIFPLHLMHCITLSPKYMIRYDFITSNCLKVKLLCTFSNICIFIAYCYYYIFHKIVDAQGGHFIALLLDPIVFIIGYSYNSLDGVFLSETHTELIIKLQNIEKTIGCMEEINKSIRVSNWCTICVIYGFYFIHTVFSYFMNRLSYGGIFRLYVILSVDSSITYSFRILVLLKIIVKSWTSEMEKTFIIPDSKLNEKFNSRIKNMEKSYTDVLQTYEIYNKIAKFPILYFVFMNFLEALMSLRNTIAESEYGIKLMFTIVWLIKCLIQVAAMSLECENFCNTVVNSYVACLYHVNIRNSTDRSRSLLRKVKRGNMRACRPLNAYGLFLVDGKLILRYMSVVTTYIVVILQFNFH